jgi:hypothetical protein
VLGNKVFIFDDFATPDLALAGAEILSINGVPIETILQTMLAGITGDGNIVTGKVHDLEGGGGRGYYRALFSPMLYPLLGIKSPFTLKYRPFQQVQERTIQITGRPFQDLVKAYEKKYPADAPFHYYDDLVAKALTFSFLSQTQQAQPLPADEFARGADGKYHWVKHLLGLMQPRQPHFAGKVYLLINGGCFSACAEFVTGMQFHMNSYEP